MTLQDDILNDIADELIEKIILEIEREGLEFTNQLKNSWEKHRQGDGSILVGSMLLWAKIQNDGRTPGSMPPTSALIPWVFQKIGARDEKELKRIAYLVARKIAEKGIPPKHYIEKALFRLEAERS